MSEDIIRMAREEAEAWRSRYELINLELSFWRKRHDMLLQAMADSALTAAPPKLLANKEAYELGRLHGADEEREACAKVCEDKAKETFSGQCAVWGDYFARAIRARSKE